MSWVGVGVAVVGAGVSLHKGNQQKKQAAALRSQRDAAFNAIPLEDPRQTQILEETRRRRRSFETGTAFASELRNIRSAQAGTQQFIQRSGGGSGATLAALSRTQLAVGKNIADIGRTSQQVQLALTDKIAAQSNLITKRKDQLLTSRFSQLSAEAAQREKEANANRNAGQAQLISAGGQAFGGIADALKRNKGELGGGSILGTGQEFDSSGLQTASTAPSDINFDLGSPSNVGLDSPNALVNSLGNDFTPSALSPTQRRTQFSNFNNSLFD